MYIEATLPVWLWIIPLIGMVVMMVLMFFFCRGGWKNRTAPRCGCGSNKEPGDHERTQRNNTLPTHNS